MQGGTIKRVMGVMKARECLTFRVRGGALLFFCEGRGGFFEERRPGMANSGGWLRVQSLWLREGRIWRRD